MLLVLYITIGAKLSSDFVQFCVFWENKVDIEIDCSIGNRVLGSLHVFSMTAIQLVTRNPLLYYSARNS